MAGGSTSAHRRDEYLQAARIGIEPDRVALELDLTPGIAVAEQVLAVIDTDGNRSIDPSEGRAYAERLLGALVLDVDATPLRVTLVESVAPTTEALLNGEGTLRVRAVAPLHPLGAGLHHLRYQNGHRPDIGVYLANALVPSSGRVAIAAQRRNADQRDLTIEYELRADRATRIGGGLTVAVAGALLWVASRRRARR